MSLILGSIITVGRIRLQIATHARQDATSAWHTRCQADAGGNRAPSRSQIDIRPRLRVDTGIGAHILR